MDTTEREREREDEREHVIVLGGSLAGLALARDLAIAGRRVTLLEASERLGGSISGGVVAGVNVDTGADLVEPGDALAALASELRLETVSPIDAGAWLIGADGRAHGLPSTHLLGVPAAPMVRDVIEIIGTRAAFRAQLDAVLPMIRARRRRSFGALVRRRMGRTVVERLVAPIVRSTHRTTPDALTVEAAARRLPAALARTGTLSAAVGFLSSAEATQPLGIRGGLHHLVAVLAERAERVGVEIRTRARVTEIGSSGVHLDGGEQLSGQVIVATDVDDRDAAVFALVECAGDDALPRGTRVFVAAGAPGVVARGCAIISAVWPWLAVELPARHHLVRLDYDTMPADLMATAQSDLRAIMGDERLVVREVAVREAGSADTLPALPADMLVVGGAGSRAGLGERLAQARAAAAELIAASAEA